MAKRSDLASLGDYEQLRKREIERHTCSICGRFWPVQILARCCEDKHDKRA